MTPSSSLNNSSNPPARRSNRRYGNSSKRLKTNAKTDNSLNLDKPKIPPLGTWIKGKFYYYFKPCPEYALKCRSIMDEQIHKCLPVVRRFFQFSINRSPIDACASTDLLLKKASILSGQIFPFYFLSLFNSKIVKSLQRQENFSTTSESMDDKCLLSDFSLIINNIGNMINHVKICTQVKGKLELQNWSPSSIKKAFFATASAIFDYNNIKHEEDAIELMNIVVNATSPIKNETLLMSQNLIVMEIFNQTSDCIQEIANVICWGFINSNIIVPLSGVEIFYVIRQNLNIDTSKIDDLEALHVWIDCIFCATARIFLKENLTNAYTDDNELISRIQPHFPKIKKTRSKIHDYKTRFIKIILTKLIMNTSNYEKANTVTNNPNSSEGFLFNLQSSLLIACNNLTVSFIRLKKILSVILERFYRENMDSKESPYQQIRQEIITSLPNSHFRYIAISALKELDLKENMRTMTGLIENCNIPIPERSSQKRSETQKSLQTDSSFTIMQMKRTASDMQYDRNDEKVNCDKVIFYNLDIINMIFKSQNLRKLEMKIDMLLLVALKICTSNGLDHNNLSPKEITETAMAIAILVTCEENHENVSDRTAIALIKSHKSKIGELFTTIYAIEALECAKIMHNIENSISQENYLFQHKIYELSKNIITLMESITTIFKKLSSTIISQVQTEAQYDLQSSVGTMQLSILLTNLATELGLHTTNSSRHNILLKSLIDVILKNIDEK